MRRAVVVLILLASSAVAMPDARAGVRYLDPVFARVTTHRDVPYGRSVNVDGELQTLTLDVYEPTGDRERARPVYVWAHGGSFKYGSKADAGPAADYARAGWVVLSVNYRLRPQMPTGWQGVITSGDPVAAALYRLDAARDAQYDIQAAVRWARANAVRYRLDPDRIAVGGFSAGAEAALMVGFNADDPGDSGNPGFPSHVAAAVSHAGTYGPGAHGNIDPGEPPVAMLHGTNDTAVPYASALPPCLATKAVLNVCELTTYPGEDHRILGADVALDFLFRHVIAD